MGYKGHIHFHVAKCINEELDKIDADTPKGEKFAIAAQIIDRAIHSNYRFWPINYYFYEQLTGDTRFADKYTMEEKAKLDAYLAGQVAKVDLPEKDEEFLRKKILEMYANPVINYIKATAQQKKEKPQGFLFFLLSHEDSNFDKQNQNLLCYHYTIGQS